MMEEQPLTVALEKDDCGQDGEDTHQLTLLVTASQESAMEAFFQINNWQLIRETRGEESMDETHPLTLLVTQEQESALEAFFQLNNWTLYKQVESEGGEESSGDILHLEETGDEAATAGHYLQQETEDGESALVEEVSGLHEIKVTATDANGEPQVITVFAEGGNMKGLPDILGELAGKANAGGDNEQQVIIQEITLPEGMTLDQGLIVSNPSVKRVTPRGLVKPGDKIHKCHICNKTFKQAQSFQGHYQSHFGAKPFKCPVCGTGFTLKAALTAHQTIHTGEKPFTCYLCNKGFRRKDDMTAHIRTHTGEKPYECDICGQKFKYRNQIPKHRRAHTGEKPYACSECEKRFTSSIHLTRHMRIHTGERPYQCTECPKAFTQFGHLSAHLRIHRDERPYPCEICGRRFREKKVMVRHTALHSADRKFKCEHCGRGFLRQSNLDLHSVMHQKGPKEGGLRRGRPRPKKRENVAAADADMREFVANVLSNVRKVDSGIQTEYTGPSVTVRHVKAAPKSLIHGVSINTINSAPTSSTEADNLSTFVDVAVEHQSNDINKVSSITELDCLASTNQPVTLVMNEDGSYLISNYEGEVTEEIISQQVEISSAGAVEGSGAEGGDAGESQDAAGLEEHADAALRTLEKAVYGSEQAAGGAQDN